MNKNFKYLVRIYLSAKEIMQKDYVILEEIKPSFFSDLVNDLGIFEERD